MWSLYKKELSNFFSSLIGYLTIAVFLVLTGLMLWVLKSDFNILDYGYAGMDGLFLIGPFLYLFLIPAITMRSLAEEKRTGTIEMLMTRPLSDWTIVFAKFLASWTLVLISLLPTLVCYVSVYTLGDPVGNIDTGSVVGSYIGLLLLGGAFVAIGLFCSSLTISPTIILNGCIAILIEVSRKMRLNRPNHIAAFRPRNIHALLRFRLPAFGSSSITSTAMIAPTSRYGLRLPSLHQVLSDHLPISGWTIIPISGGSIQKKLS